MRALLCTATIFAAMVGAIYALVVVEVPAWWWWTDYGWSVDRMPLFVSITGNIGLPAVAWVLVDLIWQIASDICAKLRGVSR